MIRAILAMAIFTLACSEWGAGSSSEPEPPDVCDNDEICDEAEICDEEAYDAGSGRY